MAARQAPLLRCQHTSAYVSIRQHTSADGCRTSAPPQVSAFGQHTSAYVSRCQHTSADVSIRQHTSAYVSRCQQTSADVSIRQQTSADVSRRQHTSADVSIRQHTSAHLDVARGADCKMGCTLRMTSGLSSCTQRMKPARKKKMI
jgi:hypothetical protein